MEGVEDPLQYTHEAVARVHVARATESEAGSVRIQSNCTESTFLRGGGCAGECLHDSPSMRVYQFQKVASRRIARSDAQ